MGFCSEDMEHIHHIDRTHKTHTHGTMANMALTPLMEKNAIGHLEQVAAAHPTLAADCKTLEELFSKKYWHEVTEFLFEIVRKVFATSRSPW